MFFRRGLPVHRLALHARIIIKGLAPTLVFSNKLIDVYSQEGLLQQARQIFDAMPERNVFTLNAIISAYIKNGELPEAEQVFDSATVRDTVTYNTMISGYSNSGSAGKALELFALMHASGTPIDDFTLTTLLNLAAKFCGLEHGLQIHGHMVKTGNDRDRFGVSSLIDVYSKCGSFEDALRVFDEAGEEDSVSKNAVVAACCRAGELELALDFFRRHPDFNDPVSWNTVIAGCAQNGRGELGLELLVHMGENGLAMNEHTFASVLTACSSVKDAKHGKEVHAYVMKNGLISNSFIRSGVVDLYCKCDNIEYAESVYDQINSENVFATASLITGHVGRGDMVKARRLFDELGEKNSVVSTALISGYLKIRQCNHVFDLFRELTRKEAVNPDVGVVINVLGACAIQAQLDLGKQIHGHILRRCIRMEEKLGSALIHMYAKCGNIKYAGDVFLRISERDRVLYNAMISGFAHHGHEKEAILLYEEMLEKGIRPDEVTFIALLSACRHGGLVDAGEKYFTSMVEDYRISPEIDHFSCMIDLLGRTNRLDKAVNLIKEIPFETDGIIWGTFLNACRLNGNVEMAKEAERKLLSIEARNGARYVQLANVYAAEHNWDEMRRIRQKMREREVKKFAGCSWVHIGNKVSIFVSGDGSHSQAEAIDEMLATLIAALTKECDQNVPRLVN